MIWHFVEVWLLILLTFLVGCLAGAHLYGYLAETRLATAQGAVADFVGDMLDGLKARVGLAPAWRRAQMRRVERVRPVAPEPEPALDLHEEVIAIAEPQLPEPVFADVAEADASAEPLPPPRTLRPLPPPRTLRTLPPPEQPAAEPGAAVAMAKPRRALAAPISPQRPAGLSAPRGGVPDNLQRIKGIGKRNERLLNDLGIFHFGQIAAWTPAEAAWIGQSLAFPDRIARDDWVGQATLLAMGTGTGFQKSAERRRERRRQEREFQARMANASAPAELGHYDEDDAVAEDEGGYEDAYAVDEGVAEDLIYPEGDRFDARDDGYGHDGPIEDAVVIEPDSFEDFAEDFGDDANDADEERR